MTDLNLKEANKIPKQIVRQIIEQKMIEKAHNTTDNQYMEYLFDAYEEFIDLSGEHDDFQCFNCRQHVLDHFKQLKPSLEKIDNESRSIENTSD